MLSDCSKGVADVKSNSLSLTFIVSINFLISVALGEQELKEHKHSAK